MTLLIFFSLLFATIVFSIILQRIIHCPILVGFAFFAIFLIVAAVLNDITFVIIAIALGILAFITAFLECAIRNSDFFRNNECGCNNLSTNLISENENISNTANTTSTNCGCSRYNRYKQY